MIQRLQSLWLLLAAISTFLTYNFPFYSGTTATGYEKLNAQFNTPVLLLTALSGVGCIIIIFLYKQRKLQFRLTIAAFLLAVLNIIYYFKLSGQFTNGNISLTAVFYFILPVLIFLAARGIWKDARLVKNLDRLR